MPFTDTTAPTAPSPRGTFSRLKRTPRDNNESSNSLASSSNSDDPNASPGLRPTTSEGVGGKLRDRLRRSSVDDRRESNDSGRRLSKLLPGRKNKLKKTETSDELGRQSSVDSGNGSGNQGLGLSASQSDSSLNLPSSRRSSLLTDGDSELEGNPIRPPLSTHPSHSGYLTLSAPEIDSQIQSVATESNFKPTSDPVPVSRSTTSLPQIIEPANTESTSPFINSSSTVEKFKGAFSIPRKQSAADADSVKSVDSRQRGLGGLFKPSSRRNSVNPEDITEPSKAQEVAEAEAEVGKSPALHEKAAESADKDSERPETPKQRGRPRINTDNTLPATPPNLIETPTTFVTPPTPTDPSAEFPRRTPKKQTPVRDRSDTLSSVDSIKHRRSQSATLPSKLSQSIPPPLSPTFEETKTPGGTLAHPAPTTGFFSSVFTAAQKAADSFSSSINLAQNQKGKPANLRSLGGPVGVEVLAGSENQPVLTGEGSDSKPRTVTTLGTGDLNFSDLGITEEPTPMVSATESPQQNGTFSGDEANNKAEEEAAARAVSEAYEKPVAAVVSQATGGSGRPLSVASNDRLTLTGAESPPRPGAEGDGMKRSGSVRSKISERRRRRHRGSSATTGNTIAAGLNASTTGLQNLGANGPGHRLTGFAVASNKRNKDFHGLFRSVPEDDYLIEDYSAALQRDILLHGRLYVSEGHICFSSNILGWVTNLVISFDEVVAVEKKSTAVIFPNAIVISTLNARNTFASFVARDSTYELIIGIWKINHPNLKSSLNGVALDNTGTGDKTEVAEPEPSESSSDTGSEDEVYDEDAEGDAGSFNDTELAPSIGGSDVGDTTLSRKTSAIPITPSPALTNGVVPKGLEAADAVVTGAATSSDFPGPPTHEPSQCADGSEHYDRPLTDTTIPAPLGKIYSLMFGPASGAFMRKWLVEDQKSRELNMADDKTGLDHDHKTMTFDYIKPLSGAIGPKQTKCITTNTLIAYDLEKAVTIDCGTQTPDVPSGSIFTTRTRYCLMWGPGNSTRMIATCTIEWTGKSWLKSAIEKGANDGQIEYVKALIAALKAAVTVKPPVKGVARKGKRKGKKEVFDAEVANARRESTADADQKTSNWGPLEPLHQVLSPVIALLSPFLTSQVIIAVLASLLLYTWINPPGRGGMSVGFPGYTSPARLAAYEEIWRREESNLWDWLDDRVGLDGIFVPSGDSQQKERQKALAARNLGKKIDDERMSERQMDDAIRVTEERLSALKEAVTRKKSGKRSANRS